MTKIQQLLSLLLLHVAVITLGLNGGVATARQQAKKVSTETNQPKITVEQEQPTQLPQPPAANLHSEPIDLSGTYAGTFRCDEIGFNGDTTLTIYGNQFTTADGKSGRIVAAKTQGYTAVALHAEPGAGAAPTVVSFRAKKTGDTLSLLPVAGAIHQCSFTPTRNVAKRSRTVGPPESGAVGTPVSNSAEVGPSPEETGLASPKPRKKKTAAVPSAPPAASAVKIPVETENPPAEQKPTPLPSPNPSPSPGPNPSPGPSPSPAPMPTPMPNPSPSPSPSPSPTPSPSPQADRPV